MDALGTMSFGPGHIRAILRRKSCDEFVVRQPKAEAGAQPPSPECAN
jgi:hypothetical protein